jgi:hypothetical protein
MQKDMVPQKNISGKVRSRNRIPTVACLCDIMDAEPSSYEEVAKKRVWKDAMGRI